LEIGIGTTKAPGMPFSLINYRRDTLALLATFVLHVWNLIHHLLT